MFAIISLNKGHVDPVSEYIECLALKKNKKKPENGTQKKLINKDENSRENIQGEAEWCGF